MANQVFNESQNYRGTWVMYLILMTELPMLVLVLILVLNSDTDLKDASVHLAIVFSVMAGAFMLLMSIRLDTRVDDKGIQFKYFPFINKWRTIPKEKIKSIEVISYNPLSDYGGWGIKGNRTTKAYNVIGSDGVLIDIGEKKKIMIGTSKASELKAFIRDWWEE